MALPITPHLRRKKLAPPLTGEYYTYKEDYPLIYTPAPTLRILSVFYKGETASLSQEEVDALLAHFGFDLNEPIDTRTEQHWLDPTSGRTIYYTQSRRQR